MFWIGLCRFDFCFVCLGLVLFTLSLGFPMVQISQDRALLAWKTQSKTVLAMRLSRSMDAKGRPFTVHLARCSKHPPGLDKALIMTAAESKRYCVDTLRETGNMQAAVQAHRTRGPGGPYQTQHVGWGQNWQQNWQQRPQHQQQHQQAQPQQPPVQTVQPVQLPQQPKARPPVLQAGWERGTVPAPAPVPMPDPNDPWQQDDQSAAANQADWGPYAAYM